MANRDSNTLDDSHRDHEIASTRTSRAWLAVAVALVLMTLAGIFIGQNGNDARLEFLVWDWTLPLGLSLFFAALVGALSVFLLGMARMVQLRRTARRHRRIDEEETRTREEPPEPDERRAGQDRSSEAA